MAKFYERQDKTIKCPKCHKILTKADKRDDRVHKLACKRCGKWIWFNPKNDTYEIKDVPSRASSGAMRYY